MKDRDKDYSGWGGTSMGGTAVAYKSTAPYVGISKGTRLWTDGYPYGHTVPAQGQGQGQGQGIYWAGNAWWTKVAYKSTAPKVGAQEYPFFGWWVLYAE